jgi:cholera toxin transcriptional activator
MADGEREGLILRFGLFELDGESGDLRKEGKAQPRLRDQSLQILLMLAERPQEIVTREKLRERLWPADTFVDFDHGLNSAINQLRNALGDSAANPRFIQTLPRRGYRFVAPVEIIPSSSRARIPGASTAVHPDGRISVPASETGAAASPVKSSLVLADPRELPSVSSNIVRALFSLVQLMYLAFYLIALARLSTVETILAEAGRFSSLLWMALILTAAAGIPVRLYLLSAMAFNYRGLNVKFRKLFPFLLVGDGLWALAPFLLVRQIGIGLAIGVTAALLYLPFSQRTLLLMGFASRLPS